MSNLIYVKVVERERGNGRNEHVFKMFGEASREVR